jgi:multidrug resistance efflux pump
MPPTSRRGGSGEVHGDKPVRRLRWAPQVAGQIVEQPVADNQFVHKGDLLMVIDPTNYKIAVSLAEAAVQQALWRDNQGERRASIKMRRGRSVCDGGRA